MKAQNITITQYSPSNLEDIKDYVDALESRLELHYKMAENKHLFTELLDYFTAHKGLEFAKEKRDVMRLFKYIPSL